MPELDYITEDQMRALVIEESARARDMGRSHIMDPDGFANHLIKTGNTAWEVSELILKRNHLLEQELTPEIARTTGYSHDFGKIGGHTKDLRLEGGDMWHDVDGPYMVLTRNEELGLINGDPEKVRDALKLVALGITSDYSLGGELGNDFPRTAMYRITKGLIGRVLYLRQELSEDGKPISLAKLTTPDTILRKIGQYSDMVSVGGGLEELRERRSEIKERYERWYNEFTTNGNYEKADYCLKHAKLSSNPNLVKRLESTIEEIERLAGLN